ncbi:hypothetical protein V8F20_011993 [Naviculisporaceae sp. PSN 640]
MALPRALLPLVKSPRFWSDYLFLTDTEYPSPYKAAFARIEDESDSADDDNSEDKEDLDSDELMEESGSRDEDLHGEQEKSGSELAQDDDDDEDDEQRPEVISLEAATNEPGVEDNLPEEDHACSSAPSSSSSASSRRPRSPYYSHTLIFPFKRKGPRDVDTGPVSCSRSSSSSSSSSSDSEDNEDTDFNLSFSISPSLSYFELTFHTPDLGQAISIAHDDQAHWHPFVLRWEELELICQAVEVSFSTQHQKDSEADDRLRHWEHPGLALLFLYRFAPICLDDDLDRIVSLLVRAWKRVLGPAEHHEKDIRRFIERMDFRGREFRWFNEGGNWWIGTGDGDDGEVYTYRSLEAVKSGKWHNEEWNKLIAEARAVVEVSGGLQELSDEDRELGVKFAPRTKQGLNLWLNLREKDRPLHQRSGRYLYLTLDSLLRILDLGRASPSGASSCVINGESVWTSDHTSISLYGDVERGKAIIKQMLWWLRAPAATSLRESSTYETLPFNLADDTEVIEAGQETYLGICVPDILPKCSWLVGHTLPDSLNDILRSKEVLKDTGQVSGPTKDGWLTVTTSDGGELGLNFSRFDGKELEGTGAVALRKITPEVSGVLHALMEESGAVLTPVGLAARPLSEDVADLSWPHHQIVDADTLHGILSGGAYQLWVEAERKEEEEEDDDDSGEDLEGW